MPYNDAGTITIQKDTRNHLLYYKEAYGFPSWQEFMETVLALIKEQHGD